MLLSWEQGENKVTLLADRNCESCNNLARLEKRNWNYLIRILTTNHIANMGKGEHISMQTLIKICETLNCDIADVIALVPDDDP